jgi:thiol-disulfide isomerase/thioredoxin
MVAVGVRELAMTQSEKDGAVTFHIRNHYSSPATAWIVACRGEAGRASESRWHWTDQETGLDGKPLAAGAETEFKFPARQSLTGKAGTEMAAPCGDFHVVAAVFADGTVTGDFRWVNGVAMERQGLREDTSKAAGFLREAIAGRTDRASLIKTLAEWRDRATPSGYPRTAPANCFVSYGWRNGGTRPEPAPSRPLARAVVSSALIGLIERGTSLAEAVKVMSAWGERLGTVAATGTPEPFGPPGGPVLTSGIGDSNLVGKPAPEFTLKDVDGRDVSLKSLRGKAVFLNFWATWCAPCVKEMPQLAALEEEFGDALAIVCIDYNETADVARKYFEAHGYHFVSLVDRNRETHAKYGGGGIPKAVLIDQDGVVRFYQQGYNSRQDFPGAVRKLGLRSR